MIWIRANHLPKRRLGVQRFTFRPERTAGAAFALALLLLCAPAPSAAKAKATAVAPAVDAAIVVTQAVGVGPLADRLGNLTVDRIAKGSLRAFGPGEAARLLRARGGPDPLRCGSDAACLGDVARLLEVRWLITVGIGRFGEMYGLEIGALDRASDGAPRTTSSTYAAPGPEWEQALEDALGKVLPAELLLPPARLSVRSNVPDAELLVDGVRHGFLPLAGPLLLPEGSYALELRKAGYSVARRDLSLAAGEEMSTELLLAPVAVPARESRTNLWPYYAGGASVLSAAVAAVFHAGASSDMDTARSLKSAGKPFAAERSDALSQIGTARVLYGVAGAAAIGAITLYLLDSGSGTATGPRSEPNPTASSSGTASASHTPLSESDSPASEALQWTTTSLPRVDAEAMLHGQKLLPSVAPAASAPAEVAVRPAPQRP